MSFNHLFQEDLGVIVDALEVQRLSEQVCNVLLRLDVLQGGIRLGKKFLGGMNCCVDVPELRRNGWGEHRCDGGVIVAEDCALVRDGEEFG